jgi:hypothetical protein
VNDPAQQPESPAGTNAPVELPVADERTRDELLRVAHHEAGHAVASFRLGFPFRHLTIVPQEGSGGHLRGYVNPTEPFQSQLTVILAGEAAEMAAALQAGRPQSYYSDSSDLKEARFLADILARSPQEAQALLRYRRLQVIGWIQEPESQHLV